MIVHNPPLLTNPHLRVTDVRNIAKFLQRLLALQSWCFQGFFSHGRFANQTLDLVLSLTFKEMCRLVGNKKVLRGGRLFKEALKTHKCAKVCHNVTYSTLLSPSNLNTHMPDMNTHEMNKCTLVTVQSLCCFCWFS